MQLRHHQVERPAAGRPARQRGAVAVEFALVVPLLFAVLFGIIDFGYIYSRTLDVRHGAREGARLLAVNYLGDDDTSGSTQSSEIVNEICSRMDWKSGDGKITIDITLGGTGLVGEDATVKISRPMKSVSGVYGWITSGNQIESEVSTRLEVKGTWTTFSGSCS